MKSYLGLLVLCILTSCYMGPLSRTVTPCAFEEVNIGDPIEEVLCMIGNPYCIQECEDGKQEYIYITRNELGVHVKRQRNFVFIVDKDLVVDKYSHEEEEYFPFMFDRDDPTMLN
jgi:hypothetical protein